LAKKILIEKHLEYIATSTDGWRKLYMDPNDSRYWELTHPYSEQHSGGPRALTCITTKEAHNKFNF
jgi:hypothetical protein